MDELKDFIKKRIEELSLEAEASYDKEYREKCAERIDMLQQFKYALFGDY